MNRLKEYGKLEDWQVEFIADKHYAIFHKEISFEWADEHGDNLCFETADQASQYLQKVFHDLTTQEAI